MIVIYVFFFITEGVFMKKFLILSGLMILAGSSIQAGELDNNKRDDHSSPALKGMGYSEPFSHAVHAAAAPVEYEKPFEHTADLRQTLAIVSKVMMPTSFHIDKEESSFSAAKTGLYTAVGLEAVASFLYWFQPTQQSVSRNGLGATIVGSTYGLRLILDSATILACYYGVSDQIKKYNKTKQSAKA